MESRVELLVSTMHADTTLLNKLNIHSNVVVVNQCDVENVQKFTFNGYKITWVDSKTRGLSVSRNIALNYATAEFVLLTDDDMQYNDTYVDIVEQSFKNAPSADIIAFQVCGIDKKFKEYGEQRKNIGFLSSMHLCSVELAMRRIKIVEDRIFFLECFGTGAKYKMGEENIFLFQCLRKKKKIIYEPKEIARLWVGDSTWFNGFDEKYFFDRGATYYEMFGILAPLMIAQFILRKRKNVPNMNFKNMWECSIKGLSERSKEKHRGCN